MSRMILMALQLGPLPSPPPPENSWGNVIFHVLFGLWLGVLLMGVLFMNSRGFRKYWGASRCIYCSARPKRNSFICYKHTNYEAVEL